MVIVINGNSDTNTGPDVSVEAAVLPLTRPSALYLYGTYLTSQRPALVASTAPSQL